MNVFGLKQSLAMARKLGDNLCVMGPSGIGKSQIIQQFGKDLNVKVHTHTLYGDPISVLGIPRLGSEFTEFQKSMLLKCEEGDIIFLDEITNCHMTTVSTVWTALSGGEIGGNPFPSNIQFVLAGNWAHQSQAAKDLPVPLIGRLAIYDYAGPTADEMLDYMTTHSWHPLIKTLLHKNPDLIVDKSDQGDQKPFHCPRQWESVSNLMNNYPDIDLDPHIISRVGEVAFQRLKLFTDIGHTLLDNAEILNDPENIDTSGLDTEQAMWVQLYSLVEHFTPEKYLQISKFLVRMHPENQIMFLKLLDKNVLSQWVMDETVREYSDYMMNENKDVWDKVTGRTMT